MNMRMKKILVLIGSVAVLAACAKTETVNANDTEKAELEAWLQLNYPGVQATDPGIYILEDTPGTGANLPETGYLIVDYTSTELSGEVVNTTSETIARRVGTYAASSYYGPVVQYTGGTTLPAGVAAMMQGMKEGGRRKAVIPSWLQTTTRYATAAEYLAQSTDASTLIYDVTVREVTEDIAAYQKQEIETMSRTLFGKVNAVEDGFYYYTVRDAKSSRDMPSDTTVYINYTGKLLNGQVFDTTVESVAKDAGIWSKSRTYKPAKIDWASERANLKMTPAGSTSSSTVIEGIQLTLWQMHPGESAVSLFWSDLGYKDSGSGKSIPAYAPLLFEIELVDNQ